MPAQLIAGTQLRLKEDLDEVVASIEFVTSAFKAYANSGQILAAVAAQPELRAVILEFRSSTRITDLNLIYQSLFIQAWSAFELFVRTLIISYVEEVCEQADDFASLEKAKLIERNLYHTGIALQQVFDNRANLVIDFFRVAQNVGTSHPMSKKVALNSFSFGMFLKGPSPRGIEEALKRIGFKDFDWDKVGGLVTVQNAFQTDKPRETAKQVTDFLFRVEKMRNNIVHRGETIQPITESDLRQSVIVFKVIGDALADFLTNSINL